MTIATDTPIAIRNIAMNDSFIRPTNGNIKFRFFCYSNGNDEENVQITRNMNGMKLCIFCSDSILTA